MNGDVCVFPTKDKLAEAAAEHAITTLNSAILQYGHAVWVLAGGTTPGLAYQFIATQYLTAVDWSKVIFIMGDERIAPLDSPDSNWHATEKVFLQYIPAATFIRPQSDGTAEQGAGEYNQKIADLTKTNKGFPRLDLVWLGMGEDGHTLSLFPNHPGLAPTTQYVIPIHNSPKPPSDRLTLTFHALSGTQECVIMAAGPNKASIIQQLQGGVDFPIARAAHDAVHAQWLLDQEAANFS